MANPSLFQSIRGRLLPKADRINEAGGLAYAFDEKHALAQYAATGCLNGTYYASAEMQLATVLTLCGSVEPEFIARTAIYARQRGAMKDLPALLCAVLSVRSPGLLAEVFDRVIDNPKMLRNFVQIMRSGAVGRKSLGTLPKRLVLQWLEARTEAQLFLGSVGQSPSLADIVKMVHPRPATPARAAMYGYLLGRAHDASLLPEVVRAFEAFKRHRRSDETSPTAPVPDVPFQMLTALSLKAADWAHIARTASWQTLRMNLNTFARHGVFKDEAMVRLVAERLRDAKAIEQARVLPYQLMVAFLAGSGAGVPQAVRDALQDAMEIALLNVPKVEGQVYVFPDISGSMHSPVTGYRKGSTTAMRCVDVAALVAAAMLRANPQTVIIPFETDVIEPEKLGLNPRDSVMTNATKLASLPAGGTNCSAPLRYLNGLKAKGDLVVYVSDNESWVDTPRHGMFGGSSTQTMRQWAEFKARNPRAKMVCIDLQPYATTQAREANDILNVGGFSDQVFRLIADVARGESGAGDWVKRIEAVRL